MEQLVVSNEEHGRARRAWLPRTVATRPLLLFEAVTFVMAAALHFGFGVDGHGHREAAIAETVIAVVLGAGFLAAWTPAPWPRHAAVFAQAFALLGVVVGVATIAVGVGPRTVGDVAYHVAIFVVLGYGLVTSVRGDSGRGDGTWTR